MTQTIEELIDERIALALADHKIAVGDLPIKQLQDQLEQTWNPQPNDVLASRETLTLVGAFSNAWVNYGQLDASFWKDRSGVVHVQGIVKNGTVGLTIFTLPTGYRPANYVRFAGVSNSAFSFLQVGADGTVTCIVGNNAWVDLSPIQFRADA